MSGYGSDLAYIHDAGFSGYALGAAPGLLKILREGGVRDGLVVDLGCGSGRWAEQLTHEGYRALGVDQSPDFVRIARRVAPAARFAADSLWKVKLPECGAVTSIGECINYTFDGRRYSPGRLFVRIRAALRPGGLFVFDAATPTRLPKEGPRRTWNEGRDWAVLSESYREAADMLGRRIICFRQVGSRYRRSEENHRLRLFEPADLLGALRSAGFDARSVSAFGGFRLPEGITGFVAQVS